ncbi:hypothetical protein MCETARE7_01204 [Candidatus Nanopelagicaceae bacterium]
MNKNKIWLVVVGLIIGGYFFASSASTKDNTNRDVNGKIQESGDLGSLTIKVGDCMNDVPSIEYGKTKSIEKVTGVPCSGSHHWEAYASTNSTLTAFTDEAVIKEAEEFCASDAPFSFLKSLPVDRQNQIATIYGEADSIYIAPSVDSFNTDKSIVCLIGSNAKYYTGSIKD